MSHMTHKTRANESVKGLGSGTVLRLAVNNVHSIRDLPDAITASTSVTQLATCWQIKGDYCKSGESSGLSEPTFQLAPQLGPWG